MSSIKKMAEEYVPVVTKNIADLEKVSVDIDVQEKKQERKNPKEGEDPTFTYLYVVVEDVEYRVPKTVLEGLQTLLKAKPDMKFFRALKSGEGKTGTKYQVIPVDE